MRVKHTIFRVTAVVFFFSCNSTRQGGLPDSGQNVIRWDKWGVPHIAGNTTKDMFYGFGFAQMEAHANTILKLYGQARGRGAEYWGKSELENDKLYRKLMIPSRAAEWHTQQSAEMKSYLEAFIQGMNAYCSANPDRIDPSLKQVLPVMVTDPLSHLQVAYHVKVGAFALQSQAAQWKNAGSNAWAINGRKSASGNTMLLMQPHPPWSDAYLFFESHLRSPGFNMYGISLVGLPVMAMGFNESIGWGLTFNQADAMDLIEISKAHDGYKLAERADSIVVNEKGKRTVEKINVSNTAYGAVIEEKNEKAIILRLSGLDRPHFFQQFYAMAGSKNLKEFEQAVSMMQLPLQNIIYADRHGSIFYLYNGIIPRRAKGNYEDWQTILSMDKADRRTNEYLSYAELPKLTNPASGFLANSNNPPWHVTLPQQLYPHDYPAYIAPRHLDLRSQRSLTMLAEKEKISFEELELMQQSTHAGLADNVLPELLSYAAASDDTLTDRAGTILSEWDRQLNKESAGAVLFTYWVFKCQRLKMFSGEWNPEEPLKNPGKLTAEVCQQLKIAAEDVFKRYGKLDIAWGDVYRINYAGRNLPSSVGLNETGSFSAGFYSRMPDGTFQLQGGLSFSAIVEFGRKVKARAVLGYGNASQKESPHFGDQLQLVSERKLREIWFYHEDIEPHTVSRHLF